MTPEEYEELQTLRAYKVHKEATRSDRSFLDLQALLDNVAYDPCVSRRAFRLLAECILALKEQVNEYTQ